MKALRIVLRGPWRSRNGFSIINRRFVNALRAAGHTVEVLPSEGGGHPAGKLLWDVYLFHGYPFDFEPGPARTNIFFLQWEYRALPAPWVSLLNERFDAVLVPSTNTRRVCRSSGVRLPVGVAPGGFDPAEFHPDVKPARLPLEKRFRFIHFGGAHPRRGTDLVVKAFQRTFDKNDDVALVVKPFHYHHWRTWLQEQLDRRAGGPVIHLVEGYRRSMAPLITACHAGVFPMRAECLGLPVLECLASGRRVIATAGTGLDQFCRRSNTLYLTARSARYEGWSAWKPNLKDLCEKMRKLFERGVSEPEAQRKVAQTVATHTWASAEQAFIQQVESFASKRRAVVPAQKINRARKVVLYRRTEAADAQQSQAITRACEELTRRTVHAGSRKAIPRDAACIIALAPHTASDFICMSGRSSGVVNIIHVNHLPPAPSLRIRNRERKRCGLEPVGRDAFEAWRCATAYERAHRLILPSKHLYDHFGKAGHPHRKLALLPPGIRLGKKATPRGNTTLTFLFDGRAFPAIKGLRPVLEGWAAARPTRARLVCVLDEPALRSAALLEALVRFPEITVLRTPSPAALRRSTQEADCALQPALAPCDGTFLLDALGLGIPVMATTVTPAGSVVTHQEDGYLLRPGSGDDVAAALDHFARHRSGQAAMRRAAWETARANSWKHYREAYRTLLDSWLP